jgi:hypothetical protein
VPTVEIPPSSGLCMGKSPSWGSVCRAPDESPSHTPEKKSRRTGCPPRSVRFSPAPRKIGVGDGDEDEDEAASPSGGDEAEWINRLHQVPRECRGGQVRDSILLTGLWVRIGPVTRIGGPENKKRDAPWDEDLMAAKK